MPRNAAIDVHMCVYNVHIHNCVSVWQGRICPAMQKKMAEDVSKKLGNLTQKLEANQVSAEVCAQVRVLCFVTKHIYCVMWSKQVSAWCQAVHEGS
jgi:hypothetical protein